MLIYCIIILGSEIILFLFLIFNLLTLTLSKKDLLFRLIEEITPPLFYIYISKKFTYTPKYNYYKVLEYLELPEERLVYRLNEEHNRATSIDLKTNSFNIGLSLALTIIASSATALTTKINSLIYQKIIIITLLTCSLYLISSTLISLSSNRNLPKFGYGTLYEKSKSKKVIVESLINQEHINIIRHIKNELSYLSLRNGIFLLGFSIFIYAISILLQ